MTYVHSLPCTNRAHRGEVQKRTRCRKRGRSRPGADVGGSPGGRLDRSGGGSGCFRHGAAGGSQGSKGCEVNASKSSEHPPDGGEKCQNV